MKDLSSSRYFAFLHDSLTFIHGITEQMSIAHVDIDAGYSVSDGPSVDLRLGREDAVRPKMRSHR